MKTSEILSINEFGALFSVPGFMRTRFLSNYSQHIFFQQTSIFKHCVLNHLNALQDKIFKKLYYTKNFASKYVCDIEHPLIWILLQLHSLRNK